MADLLSTVIGKGDFVGSIVDIINRNRAQKRADEAMQYQKRRDRVNDTFRQSAMDQASLARTAASNRQVALDSERRMDKMQAADQFQQGLDWRANQADLDRRNRLDTAMAGKTGGRTIQDELLLRGASKPDAPYATVYEAMKGELPTPEQNLANFKTSKMSGSAASEAGKQGARMSADKRRKEMGLPILGMGQTPEAIRNKADLGARNQVLGIVIKDALDIMGSGPEGREKAKAIMRDLGITMQDAQVIQANPQLRDLSVEAYKALRDMVPQQQSTGLPQQQTVGEQGPPSSVFLQQQLSQLSTPEFEQLPEQEQRRQLYQAVEAYAKQMNIDVNEALRHYYEFAQQQ